MNKMDLGIRDKRVLITGSGKGIGRSIAINLAREGAKIALVSRTKINLEEVMDNIGGVSEGHYIVESDLTKEGEPQRVFYEVKNNFGEIDILINNLGGTLDIKDPFCPIDDWRKIYRINLEVAIELSNLVIPKMKEKQWGRIVNISSISGIENTGPIPYCSVKSALTSYTHSLGRLLAKSGIVVSGVIPGVILTKEGYWNNIVEKNPEHAKKYLEENCPSGKFGEPDDIGTIVTMLCSRQAKFCQGASVLVDGGQSKGYFACGD
jgi:NAD(P)-dependent dehydrogenase (short-subunit alcohol dehydrogenase family)